MAKKPKVYVRKMPVEQPLTEKDLKGYDEVDVVMEIDLGDIIDCGGIDGFNDIADEKITGYQAGAMLADIRYEVVGITPARDDGYGAVKVRVRAQLERD